MESMKQAASNLMGSGNTTQSGQEPVSGQTGAGTVNEPYDQGNQYDDPAKGGAAAQEGAFAQEHRRSTIPEIPIPEPELHPASGNHGPHPTFAGNMLDPRTGPAAYQETFGQGAARLEPKSDKYVVGGASTGYGGIEYSTTGEPEGGASAVSTGGAAAPISSYESTTAPVSSYETTTAPTGGYASTTAPTGGYESSTAPVGGYGSTAPTSGYESTAATTGGYESTAAPVGGYESSTAPVSSYEGTTERSTGGYDTTDRSMSGIGPTDTSSSNLGTAERSTSNIGPSGRTSNFPPGGDTSVESRHSDTLSGSTTAGTTGGGIATGQPRPEHETDKTGVTSMHSNDPHGSDVIPTERDEDRKNYNVGGFGVAEPSVGADPMSAQKPDQKHQGGDRPLEEPSGEEAEAVSGKKDQAEEALNKRDPDDHSGEPMKVHGGSEEDEPDRSKSMGQPGGGEYGKEYGTGEKWVKTSGLAAEGGDFDATKPGAGKEATRLMEQKGMTKDSPSGAPSTTSTTDTGDSSSGGGITSKIKSMLGGS